MLPGRVRLQHEASLLRTNAVSSSPHSDVISCPLPPPHSLAPTPLLKKHPQRWLWCLLLRTCVPGTPSGVSIRC